MDLSKNGKFIQDCRKAKKLTQSELAQKIFVSEKTISKWECGKGFPDTTLMLPLCEALSITANELLSGKLLPGDREYRETAEQNLIRLKNLQETNSKHLLTIEWILVWFSVIILLACTIIPSYVSMALVWKIVIIVFGCLNAFAGFYFSILIETKAGFYVCENCHNKYIPKYKQVLWAMHIGRTRYMKCPKCGKHTWNKKSTNSD